MKVIRYSTGVQVSGDIPAEEVTDFLYTQPLGMYEIHGDDGAVAIGRVTKNVEITGLTKAKERGML